MHDVESEKIGTAGIVGLECTAFAGNVTAVISLNQCSLGDMQNCVLSVSGKTKARRNRLESNQIPSRGR